MSVCGCVCLCESEYVIRFPFYNYICKKFRILFYLSVYIVTNVFTFSLKCTFLQHIFSIFHILFSLCRSICVCVCQGYGGFKDITGGTYDQYIVSSLFDLRNYVVHFFTWIFMFLTVFPTVISSGLLCVFSAKLLFLKLCMLYILKTDACFSGINQHFHSKLST